MSNTIQRTAFFADACRSRLRLFLEDAMLLRERVGDSKQTINFIIAPKLEWVEFRYRGKYARLDCLRPYEFPETEQDLVEIVGSEGARAIRLTGYALEAAPNAMALISGKYEDVLKLSSVCQFQKDEKASFAFPIRFNWSDNELLEATRSNVPFEIGRVKIERHRFVFLKEYEKELYGDWVLCVLDAPPSRDNLGTWNLTFPGGKRLLGETSLECCFREIQEEIGLECNWKAVQRTRDLTCVSMDEKFCAFILHPNHFVMP